jgi:hypothetical protein
MAEKRRHRSGEGKSQKGVLWITMLLKKKDKIENGNEADTTRKAVHIVKEIDGVRQPDDPEDRQQGIQGEPGKETERVATEEGNSRCNDLAYQFGRGIKRTEIIVGAQGKQQRGNKEKGERISQAGRTHDSGQQKTQEKGRASQKRRRTPVPTVLRGQSDTSPTHR